MFTLSKQISTVFSFVFFVVVKIGMLLITLNFNNFNSSEVNCHLWIQTCLAYAVDNTSQSSFLMIFCFGYVW